VARFTGPLILRDGVKWTVEQQFTFISDKRGRIVVPKGFETDLASVPQLLQFLVPKVSIAYNQPAVVHDWLYYLSQIGRARLTRRQSDEVLREGIRVQEARYGLPGVADAVYHAVRIGSVGSWGPPRVIDDDKDDIE